VFTFLYTPSARANLTITGGAGFGPALTLACSLDSALFVTAPSLFRDSIDKFFEAEEAFEDAKLEVEDFSSGLEVAATASFNDEVEDCFDDDAEPEDELEAEDDEEIL
jgi:hypothetical protein